MYNMICEVDLFEILMNTQNMNLVLKENIFSLKNLFDIRSNHLFKYLSKIKTAMQKHINSCEVYKIEFNIRFF